MKRILIIIFYLFSINYLFPQSNNQVIQDLTQKFRDFEYKELIETADTLLTNKYRFANPDLIEIYRMKGISHYALLDDSESRLSFIEILKIDTSYTLDASSTSPKIISFFRDIKKEYLASIEGKEEKIVVTKYDTIYVPVTYVDSSAEYNLKNALIRSVIVPGTGHLYLKSNLKSWMLSILSAASIGTAIYYMIDSNEKERLYLRERDVKKVVERYNDFNFAYRMKNLAFISYAALWLYSQIDLLFFMDNQDMKFSNYLPKVYVDPVYGLTLNYFLRF